MFRGRLSSYVLHQVNLILGDSYRRLKLRKVFCALVLYPFLYITIGEMFRTRWEARDFRHNTYSVYDGDGLYLATLSFTLPLLLALLVCWKLRWPSFLVAVFPLVGVACFDVCAWLYIDHDKLNDLLLLMSPAAVIAAVLCYFEFRYDFNSDEEDDD